MTVNAFRIAAGVCAFVAVAASPSVAKLPVISLTVTDAALALAALCLIPSVFARREESEACPLSQRAIITQDRRRAPLVWARRERRLNRLWGLRRHYAIGPLWILAACVLSAASASDSAAALREIVQVGLYIVVGTAVFRLLDGKRWRRALGWSLRAAIVLGLALSLGALAAPDIISPCLPPWPTFAAYWVVLSCLTITLQSQPGNARGLRPAFMFGASAALAIALVTLAAGPPKPNPSQDGGPVPQQLREAYAALSILADYPLLGIGPGNYQSHIGEYYQGMPKENTLTPGTGIGYGILVASVGLLGLAAYVEWLRRLWRATSCTPLRRPLLALVFAGFFTPIFVGPLMLLLALLGSHAPPHGCSRIIKRPRSFGVSARLGCIALLFLSVRPVPGNAFTLVWEAEGFAELQAPMRVERDVPEASAGSTVELPLGSGQGWRGKGAGSVTYRVDIPRAGNYRLWARTRWKDGCTNAIFLSANHGPRFVFGNDAVFNTWHWVKGQQMALEKGLNYLEFANHSDGIALDKLVLTDDPLYAPAGLGDDISQFFDGFAGCDADNTGSWEFPAGRWRVLKAVGEGTGGVNDCLAQWDPKGGTALGGFKAWHDYDARARVMLPGTGTIGLTLFRDKEGTGLTLQCEVGENEARFRLIKADDANTCEIAQTGEPGNHADRWIELGVRLEKDAVVGLADGRPILSAPYSGPQQGQIALFSQGSSGAYFDNVHVTFRR